MPETSLTDMAAVRPRGPRVFLAVLGLAVAGGVAWFFFGRAPGPIGAAEDPAKVIVAGGDAEVVDELRGLGFDVEHATLDGDPLAILSHADEVGAGYVAFADPHALSFGDLEVTDNSAVVAPTTRYAVISVGELAVPHHHVSVGRDDGLYPLPPTIELLRALFEQERLAATLLGEGKVSTEAKPTFEKVRAATELLGGYGMLDIKARKIERERAESLDEPEEADPKPSTIADALESTWGFPIANGGIVLFSDRPRIAGVRDPTVRLEYAGVPETFYLPPGKTATADREPCRAPGSGTVLTRANVDAKGDAMLRGTGDIVEVWSMPASTPGCSFVRKGTIADGDSLGRANAEGKVLRAVDVDGEQMVEVWTADDSQPQVWPMSGCTAVGHPEWIGLEHFAIPCRFEPPQPEELEEPDPYADPPPPPPPPDPAAPVPPPEQSWIYFVSIQTGQVLAWLVTDTHLPALHHRPHDELSVLADLDGSRLLLLTATTDIAHMFESPPLDPALGRPAFVPLTEAGIAALLPTAFETKSMSIDTTAQNLVMSPTGKHLAFEVDHDPFSEWSTNVAVLDLATGKSKRVAIDRWAAHVDPRFSADGKTLVFTSRYEADDRTMSALRTVPVP